MLIGYYIGRHPRLETHCLTDKYRTLEYFYEYRMRGFIMKPDLEAPLRLADDERQRLLDDLACVEND